MEELERSARLGLQVLETRGAGLGPRGARGGGTGSSAPRPAVPGEKALSRWRARPPRSPVRSLAAPLSPSASQRDLGHRLSRGFAPPSPTRSHAAQVLLFRAGGQRCSPVGLGEGRTCSTLTTEVTFPAPGSGLASHPPESPSPFLPASFPAGALWCP